MRQLSSIPPKTLLLVLVALLGVNQILMSSAAASMGVGSPMTMAREALTIRGADAKTIIMPMLNPDGTTTTLTPMPTISDMPAEPKGGDVVKNATRVMIGTGTTFYAPDGITFDDPVGAEAAWGKYQTMQLTPELEARFDGLTKKLTCNFCCGSPAAVTVNNRCACAHAQAARGFFRYMLDKYGATYSDDQLLGEAYRWQAIWYPAGVVQDYLLATGRGSALPHETHGGAGADGNHGMAR